MTSPALDRAQGCLLGQVAGDFLGSLVEFEGPEEILRRARAMIFHRRAKKTVPARKEIKKPRHVT